MNLINISDSNYQLTIIESIQDNYSCHCKAWLRWLRAGNQEINSESIRDYFKHLETAGYKAKSISVMRQAVKKRVRQLFKEANIDFRMKLEAELKEIDQDIKPPKINTEHIQKNKIISEQEFKELLQACRTDKQRAFIRFLNMTACRVSEMTGIKLTDCSEQGNHVLITVLGKGKKSREVEISKPLYNSILELFQGEKYLFETAGGKPYQTDYISKQIKKIGALIGRKISAHTLRHTWATYTIRKYPDKIQAISLYMGHSDIATTLKMYNHSELNTDEKLGMTA